MLAALLLMGAATVSTPDQTGDAVLALRFIEAVKNAADAEAQSLLSPGAFLGDYLQQKRGTYEELAGYVRPCQLTRVGVIALWRNYRPLPIGVEWSCRYPEGKRTASFWLEDNKISRVGWGDPPPTIITPPMPSADEQK